MAGQHSPDLLDLSGDSGDSDEYAEVVDLLPMTHLGPQGDQTVIGPGSLPRTRTENIANVGQLGPSGLTLGLPHPNQIGGTPSGATFVIVSTSIRIRQWNI